VKKGERSISSHFFLLVGERRKKGVKKREEVYRKGGGKGEFSSAADFFVGDVGRRGEKRRGKKIRDFFEVQSLKRRKRKGELLGSGIASGFFCITCPVQTKGGGGKGRGQSPVHRNP